MVMVVLLLWDYHHCRSVHGKHATSSLDSGPVRPIQPQLRVNRRLAPTRPTTIVVAIAIGVKRVNILFMMVSYGGMRHLGLGGGHGPC